VTRDDFKRWRDDPVTRAVMAAHRDFADKSREAWMEASWNNGAASQEHLRELRVRADAYLAIAEMTYEGLCEIMGVEPSDE
jgi:hypothetical protein